MLNLQSKCLKTEFLFQDIIVFKGEKCKNMFILGSRNISSKLDYFRIHTSHFAAQKLGVESDIIKGKTPASQGQFL